MIPNGRKAGFMIFVGEVFEFAIEKTVGFFDDVCPVIWAGGPRPYGGEEFWGICFTPYDIRRIRRDGGVEPMLERTVIP